MSDGVKTAGARSVAIVRKSEKVDAATTAVTRGSMAAE